LATAAGTYTGWHRDGRLIYAGMSGRSIEADTTAPDRALGIYTRLDGDAGQALKTSRVPV
jgi:hypothetical protein